MTILFYKHFLSLLMLASFGISAEVDQRISNVIAENVLHFGHSVGLELAALNTNDMENKIFSPLSLMTSLSLLTLGAKSKSYQELKQLLGLDSDSELIQNPNKFHEQFGLMLNDLQHKSRVNSRPNALWRSTNLIRTPDRRRNLPYELEHIIKVANGLFAQNGYTLNLDYKQVLKSIYETELSQLDFQNRNAEARDYINEWVRKATFGRIPKIITENIEKTTKVILASTLYLKAFWATQFIDEATKENDFFPDGEHNPPIKVQMMATGGVFPFYYSKQYDCRIIGLPYRDNETTMYVIQPNNSTRQTLRNLQHVLDARAINTIIDKMERKTAIVALPKMHIKTSMNMKTILQNMNVHDIFVNGYSDLSLIGKRPQNGLGVENRPPTKDITFQSIYRRRPAYASNSVQDATSMALSNLESLRQKPDSYKSDLYVDDIIHNVDFSVDEHGTEAAAATVIVLMKSTEVLFRGDSPFLFVIRHDPTKLPLFYGTINKPTNTLSK